MVDVERCQKCGCELRGEAAYIERLNETWCHPCADAITFIIDATEVREGILDHQVECCPECGGELIEGFGLAGGGLGVYGYCDPCGRVIWKCVTEA
jgi:hypothetical protein